MEQQQKAGMQDHMQALTELRQYVRAEQNRPVLGASKQSMQQGGGPGMGNIGSILAAIMGGQGGQGGGAMLPMAQAQGGGSGGMPPPQTSAIASGRAQVGPGSIPGSRRRRRQRQGGLVAMPGMQNYPMMAGAGY